MTSMNAKEIIPSWAIEKATLVPAAITPVAAADPAPTNTRNAVPSASARSFWVVVGGAAMRFALGLRPGRLTSFGEMGNLLETYSTSSNAVSRNVRRPGRPRQEGRSDLPEQIPAWLRGAGAEHPRSEEHTSELQSRLHLVCRLLLEKKKKKKNNKKQTKKVKTLN